MKHQSTIRDGIGPKLDFRRNEIATKPPNGLGSNELDGLGVVRAQREVPEAHRSREVGGVGTEHFHLEVRLEPEDDLTEVWTD